MGKETHDSEAPFNMAVATLMRLDAILQQIRNLAYQHTIDSAEKQKAFISLVQQFYINSIPLLESEDIKKYKSPILNLTIRKKEIIKSGSQTQKNIFDQKIDRKLHEILIELQIKLKKYFMPKGRDVEGLI